MELNNSSGMPDSAGTLQYTLTAEDAVLLFDKAGVSRDLRTIERNCKDGQLTCIKVETGNASKYMIDPGSVDIRIKQLQAVTKLNVKSQSDSSRRDEIDRDTSGHDATHQDTSRLVATDRDTEVDGLKKRLDEMETTNRGLEIDKAVRDRSVQWLEKQLTLANERGEKYVVQLIEQSKLIGGMESQLLALAAGTQNSASSPSHASPDLNQPTDITSSTPADDLHTLLGGDNSEPQGEQTV
jgi:hypothetical protein